MRVLLVPALIVAMAVPTAVYASTDLCIIADPTPTPLNVRASPTGPILGVVANGVKVSIVDRNTDSRGNQWVYISDSKKPLGWVFRNYVNCNSSYTRVDGRRLAEIPDDIRRVAPNGNSGPQSPCLIVLRGQTEFKGSCRLNRKPNDNITEIEPDYPDREGDSYKYYIVRDGVNASVGVFMRKVGEQPAETLGDIESAGNCWRGLRATFCAE